MLYINDISCQNVLQYIMILVPDLGHDYYHKCYSLLEHECDKYFDLEHCNAITLNIYMYNYEIAPFY